MEFQNSVYTAGFVDASHDNRRLYALELESLKSKILSQRRFPEVRVIGDYDKLVVISDRYELVLDHSTYLNAFKLQLLVKYYPDFFSETLQHRFLRRHFTDEKMPVWKMEK